MENDIKFNRFAALHISARRPTKHGDAAIATLPFAVDSVYRRGEPDGPLRFQRVFDRTTALLKSQVDASGTHEGAIDALRETVAPHARALRRLRDEVQIMFVVFDDHVERRRPIRVSPETIDWLSNIGASLLFRSTCSSPSGTEGGTLCGFCGIARPLTDENAFIRLLRVVTLYLGIADARLIVRSPDDRVGKTIAENNRWWLFQPRDGLTVLVQSAQQTDEYRGGGAVAASTLLKEVRANRPVRRALLTAKPGSLEIDVKHWTTSAVARAFFRRRDVRRMAQIRAALCYELVPDHTPSFSGQGECLHCNYVQPWVSSSIDRPNP